RRRARRGRRRRRLIPRRGGTRGRTGRRVLDLLLAGGDALVLLVAVLSVVLGLPGRALPGRAARGLLARGMRTVADRGPAWRRSSPHEHGFLRKADGALNGRGCARAVR